MKINNFQIALTDVSAKTKPLVVICQGQKQRSILLIARAQTDAQLRKLKPFWNYRTTTINVCNDTTSTQVHKEPSEAFSKIELNDLLTLSS